jgi:glucoamylase
MLCLDIFTLALLAPAVASSVLHPSRRQSGLTGFIQSESTASLQGVLNNIGANGTKAAGASPGIVVASPSKVNPDCECLSFSELI